MDQGPGPNADPALTYVRGTLTDPAYVMAHHAYDAFDEICERRFRKRPKPAHLKYQADKQYWPTFMKVGQMLYENGWEPVTFIEGLLNELTCSSRYVTASVLANPKALEKYRARLVQRGDVEAPAATWTYLSESLLMILSWTHATQASVLLSPTTPFPAWFRLVYPEHLDPKIFEWHGADGYQELLRNRPLRMFLRKAAPVTFAELEAKWGPFNDVEVKHVHN